MSRPLALPALSFALVLGSASIALAEPAGARALEARLNAPCCYNGTLDIHDSELARGLRLEIERRVAEGETADAIQADFVARYGERVVAARSDAPIRGLGLTLGGLGLLAAVALGVALRRWTRRSEAPAAPKGPRDVLDERIDADLAELDA